MYASQISINITDATISENFKKLTYAYFNNHFMIICIL